MNLQGKKFWYLVLAKVESEQQICWSRQVQPLLFTMETKRLIKKPYYIGFLITAGQKFTQANFPKKYRTAWTW